MGSAIGMYILTVIFIVFAHLCASAIDERLYKTNKYNENRRTIKFGLGWLFWRGKKDDKKEIFIIAFVHETVSLILFISITAIFIVSLLIKNELFVLIGLIISFIYLGYICIMDNYIKRKNR